MKPDNLPRLVLAASRSEAGKTLITLGLIASLRRRGYRVQPFKVGPDFIDPSYHAAAAGVPSRNLDSWLMSPTVLRRSFLRGMGLGGGEVGVVEGVRGLYEGISATGEKGSTAHVAKILKAPVFLIIDAKSITKSAAALALGFKNLDPAIKLKGVILNRIGGESHKAKAKRAIETLAGIPVLGAIPTLKALDLEMPMRHLGLVPVKERGGIPGVVEKAREIVDEFVDVEKILEVAQRAEPLPQTKPALRIQERVGGGVRVGVAYDEAFNFYYPENLEALTNLGVEITPFSPLTAPHLPQGLGGLYVGGGYPELFTESLERNREMRGEIRKAAEGGMPIYGECGGLMYLARSITPFDGEGRRMVGAIPTDAVMVREGKALGYVAVKITRDNVIGVGGDVFRAHEFHYSKLENLPPDVEYAYEMVRGRGVDGRHDGIVEGNTLASYLHLHVASYPKMAQNFLKACRKYLAH